MKKIYLLTPTLLLCSLISLSQVSGDYAVMVTATTSENPPTITLHWSSYTSAAGYTVYRKKKTSTSWGSSIGTLDAKHPAWVSVKMRWHAR